MELDTPGKLDIDIVINTIKEYKLKTDNFIKNLIKTPKSFKNDFQKFLSENNLSSHMRILARKK